LASTKKLIEVGRRRGLRKRERARERISKNNTKERGKDSYWILVLGLPKKKLEDTWGKPRH